MFGQMPDGNRYASTGWLHCSPFRDGVFFFLNTIQNVVSLSFFFYTLSFEVHLHQDSHVPACSRCSSYKRHPFAQLVPSFQFQQNSEQRFMASLQVWLWMKCAALAVKSQQALESVCGEKGSEGRHRCYLINCLSFIVRPLHSAITFSWMHHDCTRVV